MRAEGFHRHDEAPYLRRGVEGRQRDAHGAGGGRHALVVGGQLDSLTLRAQELERGEMESLFLSTFSPTARMEQK